MREPALFLDLDGTVRFNREDPGGFINSAEEVALFDDVERVLHNWRLQDYLVFGVSNQGGVAFGYKTFGDVEKEMWHTRALFDDDPFDHIFFCPHHPEATLEAWRLNCPARKPRPGMALEALAWARGRGYDLDLANSLMVGDRPEDEGFARAAGLRFVEAREFFGRP